MPTAPASPLRPRPAGFSLIEVLVAIAIIIVLVGLGVAGINTLQRQALANQTQILMQQLSGIETELRIQRGNTIFGFTTSNPQERASTQAFLIDAWQYPITRQMLRQIDKEMLGGWTNLDISPPTGSDGAYLRDAWAKAIQYRSSSTGGEAPHAGSNVGRLPAYSRPYFLSAGPDGKFGEYDDDGDPRRPNTDARDNVASFDLN